MNIYIWQEVEECSPNYHSGGGVVVFANSLEEAVKAANCCSGCNIKPEELPDEVREVAGTDGDPTVYIFPNAGCC